MAESLTDEELGALPAVIPLRVAERAFGLGATKAGLLARAGDFPCPVLALGHRRVVRRDQLFEALGFQAEDAADGEQTPAGASPPSGAPTAGPGTGYVIIAYRSAPRNYQHCWPAPWPGT